MDPFGVSAKCTAGSSPSGKSAHNSPPSIPAHALRRLESEDLLIRGRLVLGREVSVNGSRTFAAGLSTATAVPRVRTREPHFIHGKELAPASLPLLSASLTSHLALLVA